MINLPPTIAIGRPLECQLITAKYDLGTYRCLDLATGEISYLIARIPNPENWERCRPTSVLPPFETAEAAIKTLERWASDPIPPPLPRPPQPLGKRRNSNRPRRRQENKSQLRLAL
jgi:hypothetical protein